MKPKTIMLVAGEASGDLLASELVGALREELVAASFRPSPDAQPLYATLEPRFFGAGGPKMAQAGVELAFDLTAHSVVGISEVVRQFLKFRRLLLQLRTLAIERQPDAIICVDFSGFNRRLAHAIKQHVRRRRSWFYPWDPKLVQYVSPQVWASREGRAYKMAHDYDLLLSIFPFEKDWYAARVPDFPVEFIGHPVVDRYHDVSLRAAPSVAPESPQVLLLPGSRRSELQRHLPVLCGALEIIRKSLPGINSVMVLPHDSLTELAKAQGLPGGLKVQVGGLPEAMMASTVALASTGTVTMECAYFGLPTVALYMSSWSTYQIAKRIVKVKHLAMPNLLAGEPVFPEFVQDQATPEALAGAALDLMRSPEKLATVKTRLARIVAGLGPPGAARRAAKAITSLVGPPPAGYS